MILESLCSYYTRMIRDPKSAMPRPGFSAENISFALSVRPDGTLARVIDLRQVEGKKAKAVKMLVPAAAKRAVNIAPNFLWDNSGYVLGVDGKGKPDRTAKAFAAFRNFHMRAAEEHDHPMLKAVAAFLQNWKPEHFASLPGVEPEELKDANCVFLWDETGEFVHNVTGHAKPRELKKDNQNWCLVTGQKDSTAVLHPAIKGVWGGQSSGGSIVSFNLDAFTSYGKKQGSNAPVSEQAAAAYTAALNYLLNRDNRRCLQVGDASTVFWAEQDGREEEWVYELLTGGSSTEKTISPEKELRDASASRKSGGESHKEIKAAGTVAGLLRILLEGKDISEALPDIRPNITFHILALAPNASRISIRLWLVSTFGQLAVNAARHQRDIAMERQFPSQPEFPALWQLLLDTATLGKRENILPPLASGMFDAILQGSPYPIALLTAIVGRIRADHTITYMRAAMIKGCLTRNYHMEVPYMLDTTRKDAPYQLGRLFALLEKAQQDALGMTINSTIRDKFMNSASSTPARVFPRLLNMAQHHISKGKYGQLADRKIAEVMETIDAFPATLDLKSQGVFFIGYYQQRNALYRKTDPVEE